MMSHSTAEPLLPALPVPPLDQTCERYLASVRPLLSDAEYAATADAVTEFQRPGGDGERLQRRLEARKADLDSPHHSRNWLEHWWNDYAYFTNRVSNCFYVNFYLGLRDDIRAPTQVQRAATLTHAAADFRAQVQANSLSPDNVRGKPLCMFQYRYLFNTCRYPGRERDYTIRHVAPDADHDYTHVAVLYRSQVFVLDTMTPLTPHGPRRPLTREELAVQFQRILDDPTATTAPAPSVALLTTDSRDAWAAHREVLLQADPANAAHLRRLETAMFVISLETSRPVATETLSRACWHGDSTGANRFHDKCLQLLVFANGRAGLCGEHSLSDATTTIRLAKSILQAEADQALPSTEGATDSASRAKLLDPPAHLSFSSSPALEQCLRAAHGRFRAEVAAHEVGVLEFDLFGKEGLKSLKCSPDAFVQMALQLAQYRTHGRSQATYESIATKKFSHGRTETARSVSNQSLAWVRAMTTGHHGGTQDRRGAPVSRETLMELCRAAIAQHSQTTVQCAEGGGVDRHLLGLRYCLKPDEPLPTLFSDRAYTQSSHWNLSTSQITDEALNAYGWGEVVPDGYGVAYMVKNATLHFTVTALREMRPKRFAREIYHALADTYDLLSNQTPLVRTETALRPLMDEEATFEECDGESGEDYESRSPASSSTAFSATELAESIKLPNSIPVRASVAELL
ncbi:Carnitine O-acetyltransferase mitochondrial [Tieghemiomyces parasiticus]|uniref:Carnitine O-acetyltransferase mitochondrial n=1 Tax=Tieghemiomyces parasiticus TaxID=78921 RepID=A0A9W7ZZC7_9FUNG|nr:Carnitine O-acetyltransferase mitochondrial [Tieghemiomyces parasiticus]